MKGFAGFILIVLFAALGHTVGGALGREGGKLLLSPHSRPTDQAAMEKYQAEMEKYKVEVEGMSSIDTTTQDGMREYGSRLNQLTTDLHNDIGNPKPLTRKLTRGERTAAVKLMNSQVPIRIDFATVLTRIELTDTELQYHYALEGEAAQSLGLVSDDELKTIVQGLQIEAGMDVCKGIGIYNSVYTVRYAYHAGGITRSFVYPPGYCA